MIQTQECEQSIFDLSLEQQYSAEQLAALQAQNLDPNSSEGQNLLAQLEGSAPFQGEMPLDPYITGNTVQEVATQRLQEVQTEAIKAAEKAHHGNLSVFEAVDESQHNQNVITARKKVEAAKGTGNSREAIQQAMRISLNDASLKSESTKEITVAVADRQSPTKQIAEKTPMEHATDASKVTEQFGKLKDKTNGRAEGILYRVANKARRSLKDLHIPGVSMREAKTTIVEQYGDTITQADQNIRAQQEIIGGQVVAAFTGRRQPRASKELRKMVGDLKGRERKEFAQAVYDNRRTGKLRGYAVRKLGKQLMNRRHG
jgi:hypothetical protein